MIRIWLTVSPLKLRALDLARIISYPAIAIAPCIELPDTECKQELPQGYSCYGRSNAASYRSLIHSERSS